MSALLNCWIAACFSLLLVACGSAGTSTAESPKQTDRVEK
jgi:hypothetical protein